MKSTTEVTARQYRQYSRGAELMSLATGLLAVVTCLVMLAELPAAQQTASPAAVAMMLPFDVSLPETRSDSSAPPDDPVPTF